MTAIINLPKITVNGYDVVAYPASYGKKSQYTAVVYKSGLHKAVWETLSFNTPKQAIADASKWVKAQR